ncbi:MAG: hypothetical protein LBE13_07640 [Bacteroidales bacterium]|jgi:hypothetical protein|nr:hypothetical protein [Bacteroidales bacterium]
MNNKSQDVNFLIFTTFITLFSPMFMVYFGLVVEQLLTFLLCFLAFLFLLNNRKQFDIGPLYIAFVFMALLLVSILRSFDVLIINDIFELGKPIYFFSIFAMTSSIHWNNSKVLKYFSSLMFMLLLGALIGIGEGTVNTIDELTSIVYKGKREVLTHKAIFSFISPYVFATVLLLPIFYNIIRLMRIGNNTIISDMFKLFVFLLCFFLTQSRTIFISLILTLIIFFLFILFNKWYPERTKIIYIFMIIVVTIVISIPFIISYMEANLNYLYAGLNVVVKQFDDFTVDRLIRSSRSTMLRFDQILFAIKRQDVIPLIGVGIGKSLFMPESLYAMYYYRVGLIGVFIHFGLIFYTIYWSLYFTKMYAKLNLICRKYFAIMSIFFAIAIYFMSFVFDYLSSAINDQTRSGFIFYVLIAIVHYYKNHYKLERT